jgi:hypothetical protein
MALRLARTNEEAHAYMRINACPACGEHRFEPTSSVIMLEGDLASRYQGRCPRCDTEREFLFRIPEEILFPLGDRVRYGDDRPSELIDAGGWMWLSDHISAPIPAEPAKLPTDMWESCRYDLTAAVAAVEEALKFVPAGADQVPLDALWTDVGRQVYQRRPGRFLRGVLTAVRDAYQELVDVYAVEIQGRQ